jgi:oligopeptide/dipeptide ABC transporter ATP-binding protein
MIEENKDTLLNVQDLSVIYKSRKGVVRALDGVNMLIGKNKVVAVVGESGCGKSTLALSIIRLLPIPPAEVTGGKIVYKGVDLLELDEHSMLSYRGTEIAMIFQEPLSSLNPVYRVGDQIAEAIAIRESRKRSSLNKVYSYDKSLAVSTPWSRFILKVKRRSLLSEYKDEVIRALKLVRIPDPEQVIDRYPFELSGGMRQRVMIAMALSEKPSLLIADEPTSALDVTTQAQVLKLMKNLMEEVKTSILLITHDLAVASQVADEIAIMYAGDIVEFGDVYELFSNPLHPYTKGLLSCIPSGFKDEASLTSIPGTVPDLTAPPKGCKFAPRCPIVSTKCLQKKPSFRYISSKHIVACDLV